MNHEYRPHWTQPLVHLRFLLILPPLAELVRRGYALPAAVLLLCLWGVQLLPRLCVSPDRVQFRFLLRHDFRDPSVAEIYRPPHLRLLRSAALRLHFSMHTLPARRFIALSVQSARLLHRTLCPPMAPLHHPSGPWMRVLAAAFQPHLAAGWALAIPLFRRAAPERLSAFLRMLPPAAADALHRLPAPWVLLTAITGVSWCIAFLRRLEESARPRLYGGAGTLAVQCGLLTRRSRVFFLRRCPGTELRQHFILHFCGIGSIYFYTGQKTPALLLPAVKAAGFSAPFQQSAPCSIFAPPRSARSRFGRVELCLLAAVLPVCCWAAAQQAFLLQYICMGLGGFLCLRVWAQQCAFPRTRVQLTAEYLLVCRCRGLSVVTTVVPRTTVTAVSVRTHWFQRRAGLCTLRIFVPGLPVLKIKHLRLRDGLRIHRTLTGIQ